MNLEKADGTAKYACLPAGTANHAKARVDSRNGVTRSADSLVRANSTRGKKHADKAVRAPILSPLCAKAERIIRGAISQRRAGSGDPAYNAVAIYGAMHRREDGFSRRVNVLVHSTPFPFAYLAYFAV